MGDATVIKDVTEINRRLFYDIWNIAKVSEKPSGLSPRLILPKRRNEEIRFSEQEARFMYCNLLNNLNYFYSIETPTKELYLQTGQTPQSASSDLSLYNYTNDEFNKLMNVEFKAHNPPMEHIKKDLEKIVKEKIGGNWVHFLKNIDSKTLKSLFEKIASSLKTFKGEICENKTSIIFSCCVYEKKWACYKHFSFRGSAIDITEYIDDFFRIDYRIVQSKILVNDSHGWQIESGH